MELHDSGKNIVSAALKYVTHDLHLYHEVKKKSKVLPLHEARFNV